MLALVDERMDSERAPIVRAFVREYMRRVEGEAHGQDAEALFNETLGVFELAAARDGAPVAVRAFNPVPAEHGYAARGTVLETNTEDLPFLVDSVSAELEARGVGIVRIVHPIIGTERDDRGRIVAVRHPREASAIESVMHFELDRALGPEELAALEDATRRVIEDPRHPYTKALLEAIPHPDPERRLVGSVLEGEIPSPIAPPSGCRFRTRCPVAIDRCAVEEPEMTVFGTGHTAACHVARAELEASV